jgi:hypothetical protein
VHRFVEKCYVFTANEPCVCVCVCVEGEVSPLYAFRPNNPLQFQFSDRRQNCNTADSLSMNTFLACVSVNVWDLLAFNVMASRDTPTQTH